MSNFSFSHSVFYPFGELSAISTKFKIVVCKLFRIGKFKNLLFGKRLNDEICIWQDRERFEKKEKMLITSIFSYFSHFQNALNFNLFDKELRGFAFVW